jgi:hypothetical protein
MAIMTAKTSGIMIPFARYDIATKAHKRIMKNIALA